LGELLVVPQVDVPSGADTLALAHSLAGALHHSMLLRGVLRGNCCALIHAVSESRVPLRPGKGRGGEGGEALK
jgi:hypothetical protein